ncbi:uncharacterized protein B0T15DRAFT_4670 [Chaetomium strumarium]|uniref:Uncharacterized protein n=1 Tax=Chaetomium strumarium TaxID=1170767 RepID=A0AAJ0H0D3_9PEZI|nr:hypothetical protein B0T15DRAFT_4670 [Chaetomium strumarium]
MPGLGRRHSSTSCMRPWTHQCFADTCTSGSTSHVQRTPGLVRELSNGPRWPGRLVLWSTAGWAGRAWGWELAWKLELWAGRSERVSWRGWAAASRCQNCPEIGGRERNKNRSFGCLMGSPTISCFLVFFSTVYVLRKYRWLANDHPRIKNGRLEPSATFGLRLSRRTGR